MKSEETNQRENKRKACAKLMRANARAYLDFKVESGQGRDAGDAKPVGLAWHDGEHRRGALRAGGVAGPRHRRRRAVEPPAAVDEQRVRLPDPDHWHGREPDGLLVGAAVPPVVEQHVVLVVVGERLRAVDLAAGVLGDRDDDDAVQPRGALHPVVRVVHVGARAVDDEGVGEGVAGEDRALGDALGAVGPRRADLPDAVPVDGQVLGEEGVGHLHLHGVALRGADRRAGRLPVDGGGELPHAVRGLELVADLPLVAARRGTRQQRGQRQAEEEAAEEALRMPRRRRPRQQCHGRRRQSGLYLGSTTDVFFLFCFFGQILLVERLAGLLVEPVCPVWQWCGCVMTLLLVFIEKLCLNCCIFKIRFGYRGP